MQDRKRKWEDKVETKPFKSRKEESEYTSANDIGFWKRYDKYKATPGKPMIRFCVDSGQHRKP